MASSEPESGQPVPDRVREDALAAFVALDRNAVVLQLTGDETDTDGRSLVFRQGEVTVEVEVDDAGTPEDGELKVRIHPDADGDVELQVPGGPSRVLALDGDARFLRGLPSGPLALVMTIDGRRYRTAWSHL